MASTVQQLVAKELGIAVAEEIDPEIATIGTSAAIVLRNNPNRCAFLIVNLSLNALYHGPFSDVSSTKGVRIPPSGGSAFWYWKEDLMLPGYEWSIVADAASSAFLTIALNIAEDLS